MGWLMLFLFWAVFAAPVGLLTCRAAGWCLNRRQWAPRLLVLLALALLCAGMAYGLLRLTGTVKLPSDNTYSYNFYDATWRDDGIHLLQLCAAPWIGIIAALVSNRKK